MVYNICMVVSCESYYLTGWKLTSQTADYTVKEQHTSALLTTGTLAELGRTSSQRLGAQMLPIGRKRGWSECI